MDKCEICGEERELHNFIFNDGVINRIKRVCRDCIENTGWRNVTD